LNFVYLKKCEPSWNCTEWSECINSFKRRECIDINNCSDTISSDITMKCNINRPPILITTPTTKEEKIIEPVPVNKENNITDNIFIIEEKNINTYKVIGIIIIIAFIVGLISVLYIYSKE